MKKLRWIVLAVLVLFLILWAAEAWAGVGRYARVLRVPDGDTIIVESPDPMHPGELREESVRFVGIDAPEIGFFGRPRECWAEEARDQLRGLLQPGFDEGNGRRVRVHRVGVDSFGRTLAYVYLDSGRWPDDARHLSNSLNLYLLANGYARQADPKRFPHRYTKSYGIAEAGARSNHWGLWQCR